MNGSLPILYVVSLLTLISFIGANFSELARALKEAKGDSICPRMFQEACGALFQDEKNRPLNGDTAQDTAQFINEVLRRLHDEEIMERTEKADADKPSFVEELFGVRRGMTVSHHCHKSTCRAGLTIGKLGCGECGHTRGIAGQPVADCFGLSVVVPTSEETTMLGELLEQTRSSELLDDYRCPGCSATNSTTQQPFVERLPKCLIVQACRARHGENQNGRSGRVSGRRSVQKIHTPIGVPAMALDLSSLLQRRESSEADQYDVFGIVEHSGLE